MKFRTILKIYLTWGLLKQVDRALAPHLERLISNGFDDFGHWLNRLDAERKAKEEQA